MYPVGRTRSDACPLNSSTSIPHGGTASYHVQIVDVDVAFVLSEVRMCKRSETAYSRALERGKGTAFVSSFGVATPQSSIRYPQDGVALP